MLYFRPFLFEYGRTERPNPPRVCREGKTEKRESVERREGGEGGRERGGGGEEGARRWAVRRDRAALRPMGLQLAWALCAALVPSRWVGPVTHPRSPRPAALLGRDTQIVTDIDDTIKSSGGLAIGAIELGGVDTSYARGSFYPGVFQFGLEISCCRLALGASPAKVAVLTARAVEFRQFLEIKQSDKLCVRYAEAGSKRGLRPAWGVGPVLYGSVQEWICQERKGWRKAENFKLLRQSAPPSRRYVFVGDNGASERDLDAAERIAVDNPGALRAVFLHAVSSVDRPAPLPEDFTLPGGVPVRYFRTYATAAAKACELGLLSSAAVERVLDAIEEDMDLDLLNLPPGSPNRILLEEEIEAARKRGGRRLPGSRFFSGRFRRKRAQDDREKERDLEKAWAPTIS